MLRERSRRLKCGGGACIGLFPPPKSQQPWLSEWHEQRGGCSICGLPGRRGGGSPMRQPAQHHCPNRPPGGGACSSPHARRCWGTLASPAAGASVQPAAACRGGRRGCRRPRSDWRPLRRSPPAAAAHVCRRPCSSLHCRTLTLRGELLGHKGWVTAIAAPLDPTSETLLSSSRSVLCLRAAARAAHGRQPTACARCCGLHRSCGCTPHCVSRQVLCAAACCHALLRPPHLSTPFSFDLLAVVQRQDRAGLAAGQRR